MKRAALFDDEGHRHPGWAMWDARMHAAGFVRSGQVWLPPHAVDTKAHRAKSSLIDARTRRYTALGLKMLDSDACGTADQTRRAFAALVAHGVTALLDRTLGGAGMWLPQWLTFILLESMGDDVTWEDFAAKIAALDPQVPTALAALSEEWEKTLRAWWAGQRGRKGIRE